MSAISLKMLWNECQLAAGVAVQGRIAPVGD
jgi:hypothetical protein